VVAAFRAAGGVRGGAGAGQWGAGMGHIYVAQIKGAAYASGFDHIVYGWFFFAAVIAAIIALSWPFFDRASTIP
jgi:hypothetical protein